MQTLWSQYARKTLTSSKDARAERLIWATLTLKREVLSFNALTKSEARTLIETLHGALGLPDRNPPKRIRSRDRAHSAGTEGRRGSSSTSVTLASRQDLDRILDGVKRLGWSDARFQSWLRSPSSPLARKEGSRRFAPSDPTIRTVHDANRVWWALKGMLQREGKWR